MSPIDKEAVIKEIERVIKSEESWPSSKQTLLDLIDFISVLPSPPEVERWCVYTLGDEPYLLLKTKKETEDYIRDYAWVLGPMYSRRIFIQRAE